MNARLKVLHVVECFSGGTATSINSYIDSAVEFEHHVLASAARVPDQSLAVVHSAAAGNMNSLSHHHLRAIIQVVRYVNRHRIDVVHAHSSFAGFYVRLASLHPSLKTTPIVYTPHGLAFMQSNRSRIQKYIFRFVEKVLSLRTTVLAGCSTSETQALKKLSINTTVDMIPNALMPVAYPIQRVSLEERPCVIAIVGRVCQSRNPDLLIRIKRALDEKQSDVKLIWIGDGDPDIKERLFRNGIEVTGWLTGADLDQKLKHVAIRIHTTLGEGFPMAILEAIEYKIPIFIQNIPALSECPSFCKFDNESDAVSLITDYVNGVLHYPMEEWGSLLKIYSKENQRTSILRVYMKALGGSSEN